MKLTCLIIDDEPLERSLTMHFAKRTDKVTVLAYFEDLFEAFQYLEKNVSGVDSILLNIRVDQNYRVLLLAQTGKEKEIRIIFTGSYPPNLFKNYDIRYFEWLQKSIPYQDFNDVIQKLSLDKMEG